MEIKSIRRNEFLENEVALFVGYEYLTTFLKVGEVNTRGDYVELIDLEGRHIHGFAISPNVTFEVGSKVAISKRIYSGDLPTIDMTLCSHLEVVNYLYESNKFDHACIVIGEGLVNVVTPTETLTYKKDELVYIELVKEEHANA